MAVQYRTKGFVLTKEDRGEADQVFSVFTEDFGKIKVKAKSIRKIKSKLRSGIDLFYFSEIEFVQGKNIKTLTDAKVLEKFKNIRNDLEEFKIAQKIGELTDKLIKGEEKDERIFNLLNNYFCERLSLSQKQVVYCWFFWNLVSLLGYQIDLYHCAKCHKKLTPSKIGFLNRLICENCLDKEDIISPEAIKILRLIQEDKEDILSKLKIEKKHLEELNWISEQYLLYLMSVV